MTWFDVIALLLIIVVAWVESLRGFGRAVFDLLGGVISLKMASLLSEPLANAAPIAEAQGASQAFWLSVLFLVFAALTVIGCKLIYDNILLSLDVLDPLVGAVLGIASGVIVAHVFLKVLLLGYADTQAADIVLNSFMGQEILKFRSYHTVITALHNLGNW